MSSPASDTAPPDAINPTVDNKMTLDGQIGEELEPTVSPTNPGLSASKKLRQQAKKRKFQFDDSDAELEEKMARFDMRMAEFEARMSDILDRLGRLLSEMMSAMREKDAELAAKDRYIELLRSRLALQKTHPEGSVARFNGTTTDDGQNIEMGLDREA